jgi:hypothetical protein
MPLSGADVVVHLGFLVALTAIGVWLALRSFVERLGR